MTTIRDVAKQAGVSVTTASYVLNGIGNIGEATRGRTAQLSSQRLRPQPEASQDPDHRRVHLTIWRLVL